LISSCFFGTKVVDCRICGDPNSVLRFAFVEFTDEGNFKTAHTSYFSQWMSLAMLI
jgi:hypothetical protein